MPTPPPPPDASASKPVPQQDDVNPADVFRPSQRGRTPLTPESLVLQSGEITKAQPYTDQNTPQTCLRVEDANGQIRLLPYIRFTGAIIEGMAIVAIFDKIRVMIVRADQGGGDEDEEGKKIIQKITDGLQNNTLQQVKHTIDVLDVAAQEVKEDDEKDEG
jgi:hypothetical protein